MFSANVLLKKKKKKGFTALVMALVAAVSLAQPAEALPAGLSAVAKLFWAAARAAAAALAIGLVLRLRALHVLF